MMYVWLAIGFLLLMKGADWFVDGASAAARRLRVPSVVIGLTIVAMGTSLPEAAVSIAAGLMDNGDIAIGNVIGSNLCDLLLVLGVAALIRVVPCEGEILRRDFPWSLFASALTLVFVVDGVLARWEGALLLVLMAAYLVYVVRGAVKVRPSQEESAGTDGQELPLWKLLLLLVAGGAAIVWGGDLVVDSASAIAKSLGMSDALVGCTIVAIGTSLPELVTSTVAAWKGDTGLAVGNVVGSCIFNLLFILGASAALTPLNSAGYLTSAVLLLAGTALTWLLCRTGQTLSRKEGVLLLAGYGAYMGYAILCI